MVSEQPAADPPVRNERWYPPQPENPPAPPGPPGPYGPPGANGPAYPPPPGQGYQPPPGPVYAPPQSAYVPPEGSYIPLGGFQAPPAQPPALPDGDGRAGGDGRAAGGVLRNPYELPRSMWWQVLHRTVREFRADQLTDLAATLTYYGVLSIFPGLIVLISVLGLLGPSTVDTVKGTVSNAAPGAVGTIFNDAINRVQSSGTTATVAAILGLVAAFWSASGYIAAFMRASNVIYDVPEGRPIWKTLPIRIAVTSVVGLMLILSALIVVFTGELARQVGNRLGAGSVAVTAWDIGKWPVLVLLVGLIFAILYWASPNARHGGFRWASPGALVAVVLWLIGSGLFAAYVANFASYNATYGTLAGIVVFLVWLWVTNVAVLLGAEVDAELERQRAIVAGHPADKEPFLQLRDDRKLRARPR